MDKNAEKIEGKQGKEWKKCVFFSEIEWGKLGFEKLAKIEKENDVENWRRKV
jgi:hypothetical protein